MFGYTEIPNDKNKDKTRGQLTKILNMLHLAPIESGFLWRRERHLNTWLKVWFKDTV